LSAGVFRGKLNIGDQRVSGIAWIELAVRLAGNFLVAGRRGLNLRDFDSRDTRFGHGCRRADSEGHQHGDGTARAHSSLLRSPKNTRWAVLSPESAPQLRPRPVRSDAGV